jgi:hypothetical protein
MPPRRSSRIAEKEAKNGKPDYVELNEGDLEKVQESEQSDYIRNIFEGKYKSDYILNISGNLIYCLQFIFSIDNIVSIHGIDIKYLKKLGYKYIVIDKWGESIISIYKRMMQHYNNYKPSYIIPRYIYYHHKYSSKQLEKILLNKTIAVDICLNANTKNPYEFRSINNTNHNIFKKICEENEFINIYTSPNPLDDIYNNEELKKLFNPINIFFITDEESIENDNDIEDLIDLLEKMSLSIKYIDDIIMIDRI